MKFFKVPCFTREGYTRHDVYVDLDSVFSVTLSKEEGADESLWVEFKCIKGHSVSEKLACTGEELMNLIATHQKIKVEYTSRKVSER